MRHYWRRLFPSFGRGSRAKPPFALAVAVAVIFFAANLVGVELARAQRGGAGRASQSGGSSAGFSRSEQREFYSRLRNRSREVRLRALAELGEYADPAAVQLVVQHGLVHPDSAMQQAACESLLRTRTDAPCGMFLLGLLRQELFKGRRSNQELVASLERVLSRSAVPEVFSGLLVLAEAAGPTAADSILSSLMQSVDQRALENDEHLPSVLMALSGTPEYREWHGLRQCAVNAAIRLRQPAAVPLLIEQLELLDGELRFRTVRHLAAVTRQSLGDDAEAWRRWWQANQAGFQFADFPGTAIPRRPDDGAPRYYDFVIHAKRVVFVLDTSKSMAAGDGLSRLEAAKRELVRTITDLSDDVLFNIVAFDSEVRLWAEQLTPAAPVKKTQAIAFVRAQQPAGETATYEALSTSLSVSKNLESIYFLSDGVPSTGEVVQPELLLKSMAEKNRFLRVSIHTIGVFGGNRAAGLDAFMQNLAEQNYGEFRRVN